jgi:hypothetical protein
MEDENNIEKLFGDVKDYIDTRLELSKLQAVEQGSKLASAATVGFLLLIFFGLIIFFASTAFAYYLGQKLGDIALGFLSVAGIYLVLALILFAGRKSWIGNPMTNLFIRKMLNKDEDN